MIVVTGAAGFIGSNLVRALNARGHADIVAVDNLTRGEKSVNLADLAIADYLDKEDFRARLAAGKLPKLDTVFHQGACSDTMQMDGRYMMDNNYRYSMELLEYCGAKRVPLIYASSASVYGASQQFVEDPAFEKPLNVYGYSKLLFDQVVRRRLPATVSQIVGMRYFNVYGPREQHKGRMASVAYHQFHQMRDEGHVRLFEGSAGYGPGEQRRDFIHVDDIVAVNLHFFDRPERSGIFNVGTGRAQSFNDVSRAVVNSARARRGEGPMELAAMVEQGLVRYVPFPQQLVGRYQSYTQADVTALRASGFEGRFLTVEEGVSAYCQDLAGVRQP